MIRHVLCVDYGEDVSNANTIVVHDGGDETNVSSFTNNSISYNINIRALPLIVRANAIQLSVNIIITLITTTRHKNGLGP